MISIPGPGYSADPLIAKLKSGFEASVILGQDGNGVWLIDIICEDFIHLNLPEAPRGMVRIVLWPQQSQISYTYALHFSKHLQKELEKLSLTSIGNYSSKALMVSIINRSNSLALSNFFKSMTGVRDTFKTEILRFSASKPLAA